MPSTSSTAPPSWPSPEALVALYNELAPAKLPRIATLSDERRKKAKRYLRQFPGREFWETVFSEIGRCPFLLGERPSADHPNFRADFDWLLTKGKDGTENAVKVFEGKYRDKDLSVNPQGVTHEPGYINLR